MLEGCQSPFKCLFFPRVDFIVKDPTGINFKHILVWVPFRIPIPPAKSETNPKCVFYLVLCLEMGHQCEMSFSISVGGFSFPLTALLEDLN